MTSPIALLAPYLPAPAYSGGRIRINRFAHALARHFDVHLFAAVDDYEIRENLRTPELEAYATVHIERKTPWHLPEFTRPRRVRTVSPRRLVSTFLDADRRTPFQAAVVEHSHAAATLQYGRRIPWLLDEHNVESDYADARSRALGCPLNVFRGRQTESLRRWEEGLWKAANEVVCVSPEDARRVEVVRGRPAPVVPNGVCTDEVPFKLPSARGGHEILFVGILEHPPNVAAARWLSRAIFPRVLAEEPRARLTLCGARPAREVLELARERVTVTGSVPSVTPYLDGATVYANPLKQGAGSSLKVLEALASGVPLISTSLGARGFELGCPDHYLCAEDTDAFVRQILTCFREPGARDAAAVRGRAIAESCSWAKLSSRFVELVQRVARE